jgi:hypothetical protein
VKLPPNILAARDRLEKADVALDADTESITLADKVRHSGLIEAVRIAAEDYARKLLLRSQGDVGDRWAKRQKERPTKGKLQRRVADKASNSTPPVSQGLQVPRR